MNDKDLPYTHPDARSLDERYEWLEVTRLGDRTRRFVKGREKSNLELQPHMPRCTFCQLQSTSFHQIQCHGCGAPL